jgi:hypothetical protein
LKRRRRYITHPLLLPWEGACWPDRKRERKKERKRERKREREPEKEIERERNKERQRKSGHDKYLCEQQQPCLHMFIQRAVHVHGSKIP